MYRRFHHRLKRNMVIITPGEYYVTMQDEVIATVLGSCISVCIKDEKNGIGGMNHFMLPGDFSQADVFTSNSGRYGMYAMELIMGDLIKMGGDRQNLTAKVFGGGHVLQTMAPSPTNVPASNIDFVKSFLSMEGIPVVSSDVGGRLGRKILYLPKTGKVFLKRLTAQMGNKLADREHTYQRVLKQEVAKEDLTMF